ncbi:hypothetical protein OOK31_28445 [Streptomyces sp. NBC_00249]|uniref:hypothetical protein n=1 Tax=Streptomyces sp. NBC_00249 TaxID=2975690 RepID=UPI00224DC02A|nr:hypothetical protein [Streptomyces sp. NBC_00249]MCX5197779.1 hypothetical protein [Streptomyces sp. NBC_00249]
MTVPPPPATHLVALGYAETSLGEVDGAGFGVSPTPDGDGLTVRGSCPRCGGPTTTTYRYGVPGLGTKGLRSWFAGERSRPDAAAVDPLRSEAHFCECGHAHPGMPGNADFVGCGAGWTIRSAP